MSNATLERLESLFTVSPRAVLVLAPTGVVHIANSAAHELFEYGPGELSDRPSADLFVQQSAAAVLQTLRGLARSDRARALALTTRTNSGRRIKVDVVAAPLRGDHGEFLGASLNLRRRRRPSSAPQERTAFSAVLRGRNGSSRARTLSAEISSWSDRAAYLFGFSDLEIIGKDLETLVPDDRRDSLGELVRRIALGEMVDHFEDFSLSRSGVTVETISEVLPIAGGREGMIGLAVRVHERSERTRPKQRRASLDNSEPLILLCDANGEVVARNKQAEQMLELRGENIVGRPLSDFLPAEVQRDLPALIDNVAEGAKVVIATPFGVPALETLAVRSVQLTPVTNHSDVRFSAEFSVDRHAELLHAAVGRRASGPVAPNLETLAGIGTWSFVADSDAEASLDAQARLLFGFKEDEHVLPPMLAQIVHPDDSADACQAMLSAFASGERLAITFRVANPDGGLRSLHVVGEYVPDPKDETTRFFGLVEDVTEQQERLEETQRTQRFAEQLFEDSPIGAQSVDPEGRIVVVNDTMLRLLGYSRSEYLGRTFEEMTHAEDRAHDEALFQELLAGTRDTAELSKRILRADGTYIRGRLRVAALRDESGALVSAVAQFLDESATRELVPPRRSTLNVDHAATFAS